MTAADGNGAPEPPRTHSDALWQPREPARVEASVGQYSRFVARMKVALPVAAGVILLLVLLLPQFQRESDRFRIGLKNVGDVTTDTLSMMNARYFGTDDNGEPFSVTAEAVHERPAAGPNDTKLIDLTRPRAELSTKEGKQVKVNADAGVYDRKLEVLELSGQVDVVQSGDYEMHTTAAQVHLKDSTATGNAPVQAKGSFGTIAAAGFTARQNDKVLTFTGPATLVLNTDKKDGDGSAPTVIR